MGEEEGKGRSDGGKETFLIDSPAFSWQEKWVPLLNKEEEWRMIKHLLYTERTLVGLYHFEFLH